MRTHTYDSSHPTKPIPYKIKVLLLPHGFEGQGPEHSSARIERFLQLVNDDPDITPGFSPELVDELKDAFHRIDHKCTGYIDRTQLYELLMDQDPVSHMPSPSSELTMASLASFDGNEAHHQKRSLLLLMNEITDPATATAGQRFSCDDYIKYASTWIRRHYEENYNVSVCNTTTPAQYFHVLRRQVHRPFVKPLVLFTGKWLQHHAACTSRLEDMGPGTWFRRIISEKSRAHNLQNIKRTSFEIAPPDKIERIIICSGKIFYELYHARSYQASSGESERLRQNARKVTLVRLEQLAPFPMDRVASAVNSFPLAEVFWVQEEPKNQGAWSFVQPRFKTAMKAYYRGPVGASAPEIKYIGRPVSATTAGGSFRDHVKEQRDLVRRALDL